MLWHLAVEGLLKGERRLGAAVVGLGVGVEHALAYMRTGGCVLRWLYDLDRSRAESVVAELGRGAVAESVEAILADAQVDVVSIASYDDAHFGQVISALKRRKHVFVEKPICRSMEELRAVKRAWRRSHNRHLASNLVLRAAPLYCWLKEAIDAGELGEVYAFDGDYLYGRIHKIVDGWRGRVEGYSVMLGGGVHLVDLMLWLSGQRAVSVSASGSRIATAGRDFRYNDYVSATFQFASGMIGRITANFGCMHRHQHVVRVFGTRGTFIYDDRGPRLHASRDPSVSATPLDLSGAPASKGDLIPGFVGAILKGEDTSGQAQREFDVISACVAADQALGSPKSVEIDYI